MTGIRSAGAYAPRFRVAAEEFADAWGRFEAPGIETKAVPDADEDALTMAWEAATRALAAADATGADVDFLAFASTTPPLAEEDLTARLGSMLGVQEGATRHVFTGSTRAGTRALFAALDHADGRTGESDRSAAPPTGLVVAADCPRGEPSDEREHAAGAGAAAFVVGRDAPAAVVDRAEHATPYPGTRFRETGSDTVEGIDVNSYDRQAFTETLAGAVDRVDADEVDAAGVQQPDGKLPYRAASALGVSTDEMAAVETVSKLGDTGAASVPLSLARALDEGGRTLAASWGSGAGADALVVEGGCPTDLALEGGESVSYAEYLRLRGDVTDGEPAGGGAYVSIPTWRRSLPQRHRLVAGECPECDGLAFPPEGACLDCGRLVEFERVPLSGEGEIEAYTEIGRGGAPPEFAEQQQKSGSFGVAIVAFDAPGGSVSAPAQVVEESDVGDRVVAVQRRIYEQEGVARYGFKVRPSGGR